MYYRYLSWHTFTRYPSYHIRVQSVTVYDKQFIITNYVSEHQLPHIIDASHTTPATHVNRDPKLLKLIGWRHIRVLSGSCTYPGSRPRLLTLNQVLPQGSQITCISGIRTGIGLGYQSPHGKLAVEPSFGCNLYPRSTQNTDVVSFINFSNPGVSYLMSCYYLSRLFNVHIN